MQGSGRRPEPTSAVGLFRKVWQRAPVGRLEPTSFPREYKKHPNNQGVFCDFYSGLILLFQIDKHHLLLHLSKNHRKIFPLLGTKRESAGNL